MSKDTGGAAFPRAYPGVGGLIEENGGMSLRDWFAGQALAGWIANAPMVGGRKADGSTDSAARIASAAYTYADAMLEARKK